MLNCKVKSESLIKKIRLEMIKKRLKKRKDSTTIVSFNFTTFRQIDIHVKRHVIERLEKLGYLTIFEGKHVYCFSKNHACMEDIRDFYFYKWGI